MAQSPPKPLLRESSDLTITPGSTDIRITLTRSKPTLKNIVHPRSRPQFRLKHQSQYQNSLLAAVGYLELANAFDFAANVWNEIPVPRHALILMAIGGPIALFMSLAAARDFSLALRNVKLLLRERQCLLHALQSSHHSKHAHSQISTTSTSYNSLLRTRLAVSTRELGSEGVDRLLLDLLMGIGALLVGIGTILAIWGADHTIFKTSNLLSGYIGNGFAAVFGLVNAIWSVMLVLRFQKLIRATTTTTTSTATTSARGTHTEGKNKSTNNKKNTDEHTYPQEKETIIITPFADRLTRRFRRFQGHALVNGVNGLVAGAASMVTATRWEGYVVLVPCVAALVFCNYFWRLKLGYDRPVFDSTTDPCSVSVSAAAGTQRGDKDVDVVEELACVTRIHRAYVAGQELPWGVVDGRRLDSVVGFMARNAMFEDFCVWVAREGDDAVKAVLGMDTTVQGDEVTLALGDLLQVSETQAPAVLEVVNAFLRQRGRKIFAYRERYLLELVGCSLAGPEEL